ncbi:uncharacterized protein LOC116849473 [Odontomachus brunneus]|uniref:uncharacterized protein LOC116849473 n=1 Tax=Odontomachus brunneus TaxID=486640 RepID=UPI0013F28E71|nr:uncharacterized protein LOC116849473 [Odontomachus brunneus]
MKYHRRQCIHLLLQVILLAANCLAENLTLSINFERRIFVTNGAFLSLTVDPTTLLNHINVLTENIGICTNMVQGLAPAYVRFGGPWSNSYIYDRVDVNPNDMLLETHSTLIHRWAENAGLDVIACISPRYIADKSGTWEPTNLTQLLSFNDRMGHNVSWQLGYECQTRCDLSGGDLGRYVANLRETLRTYPRYSDNLITGPDIVAYGTAQQRQYLRDYLSSAGDALSAITWHPDFAGITVHGNDISVHSDNMASEKDELYKVIGDIALDMPLWIAESKPEDYKHSYLGALTWTRRLGNAAKLGVQVVMRQFLEFSRPTPDYWVSFLHKALVGREVLEVEVQSDDESHVHFYSQCTRPSEQYEKGALTIFGVNLTPREVIANLKGFKIKTLHEYILSPDSAAGNKMFTKRVLLNGEPLNLIDNLKLPDLNPEIVTDSDGLQLKLASNNIGFWVIPNAKVKACTNDEEGTTKDIATKKISKRHITRQVDEGEGQEKEDINSSNSKNRKLRAKQERITLRNDRNEIRRRLSKTKLYKIKKLLQKRQQKEGNETSILEKPSTINFTRKQGSAPEEAEIQQNIDNEQFEKTEKPNNETKINNIHWIQDTPEKNNYTRLNRKSRAEHSFKPEMRDVNKAITLISKIEALLQPEKEVTSNDVKDEIRNSGDTVIGMNGEVSKKFGELAEKSEINTIEEIEKYLNVFHDLLENNELITTNVGNNQIPIHESLTNKKRHIRDLSKRSEGSRKDISVRHRRTGDLEGWIKRKMKKRIDDRKETSPAAFDLRKLNRRSILHSLFRRYPFKRFLQSNSYGDSQQSIFNIQERGRPTRDVDRLTEISARKDGIFRKRAKFDDMRDHVNEKKSKRKDDFKWEVPLSLLNPRIVGSLESGFLRRDPIKGFPEGDVFVTTGVSAERSGLDYVEDDEDDSGRKDQQQERESTVESAEDSWMETNDDRRDYTPNEFYENVYLPNARIRENAKDYDDLYEAEFVFGNRENNKDSSATTDYLQPFDEEKTKRIEERSAQQLVDYQSDNFEEKEYNRDANYEVPGFHLSLSTPLHQLTEIPAAKNDFTNYQTSEVAETARQKLQEESKISSFFYQPALDSSAKNDYGNFQVSIIRPNVEYMGSPINNRDNSYNKRNKRSYWKNLQRLFDEEMIKEDPSNAKDCRCRVIRAHNSPKEYYNNRRKRDQMSVIESAASEAADENAKVNPDLARPVRNMPSPITKEEFDRIMTGEILPSTSVIETDSDYNRRDAVTIRSVRSSKSHRRANKAMQTMDVDSTIDGVQPLLDTSDTSAQRVMEEQTFFRAQPSATSAENEETTYDPVEAAIAVSSRNKKNRQEPFASESAQQAPAYLCEETQDLKEETQRESTDASTKDGKEKGGTCSVREDSSKLAEETIKSIAQEQMTTETSKRAARKTIDSRSNKSKTRKESKESQQSENEPSPSDKYRDRARVREKNDLRTITSVVQDFPKTQLKDLARYEEYLVRRRELIQNLKEKLKERRQKNRKDPAKIADELTRNLTRREAWERFYENSDLRQSIDQERLLRFLVSDIETQAGNEGDDDDNDVKDEEDEEDRYLPVQFVPERYDSPRDQTYSRANVKHYPEYYSHYYYLQHPKVTKVEQEPVTSYATSTLGHRIFAIDPSTYCGGEPVLELHEEYLEPAPKYSSKIKFQTPAPRWPLNDFYRPLVRPIKVYGDQRTFKPYDNYYGREYTRKSQIKDARERENAVALYLLDKHRQYDLPEKLAELPRIYLSVLDRRDINQATKDKTTSDSSNDDAKSGLTTTRKVGLPKEIDEEYTGTNKYTQQEELGDYYNENVGEEIDRSQEINDEVDDSTDTDASKMKTQNAEERIADGDFKTSELLDTWNTTPRSPSKAIKQMADKSRQRTRRSRVDARTELDHDKYICMKEEDSKEISSEQSIPLYQLTRLLSDAVLFRKLKDYATFSSKDFDRQGEKQFSKYMILMPDKIKDVHSYEMSEAKNSERSSKRFEKSRWFNRYLPRRITNAVVKYLNDVSSEELEYDYSLDTSGSVEKIWDEEVSYSSDYSNESSERRRKAAKNVAEIGRDSREENQQHGIKSKESHGHLKMKDQMQYEEHRAFMPLPEKNEKTKRQRRQVEINEEEPNKSILTKDDNDQYYLQRNSIDKKGTSTNYLHSQKDGRIGDDLLEDFAKSRKNVITSTGNQGNNESLENTIAKSDKKMPSFMEETIPNLQRVIVDGLEKAKDLTESVEQFVDHFEEDFNETLATDEETSSTNKTSESTSNPFHLAIINLKKLFTLFTGIS